MVSSTSVHAQIRAALDAAGVHAVDGPADDLPTSDGLVGQAAVLWPQSGVNTYSRATGTRSGRTDRVSITCVGATSYDALAVADRVEEAIGGMRVTERGGTLQQALGASFPAVEPNTDPRRVSLPVEYIVVTKG